MSSGPSPCTLPTSWHKGHLLGNARATLALSERGPGSPGGRDQMALSHAVSPAAFGPVCITCPGTSPTATAQHWGRLLLRPSRFADRLDCLPQSHYPNYYVGIIIWKDILRFLQKNKAHMHGRVKGRNNTEGMAETQKNTELFLVDRDALPTKTEKLHMKTVTSQLHKDLRILYPRKHQQPQ